MTPRKVCKLFFGVFTAFLCCASSAFAQKFSELDVGKSVNELGSFYGPSNSGAPTTDEDTFKGSVDDRFYNYQASGGEAGSSPTPNATPSAGLELPMVYMDARSGQVHGLMDETTSKISSKTLGNPNTVVATTLQLTEPAVGLAHQNMLLYSQLSLANTYASFQAMLNQFSMDPQNGQASYSRYLNCIKKKIGKDANAQSWRYAVAWCTGESVDPQKITPGLKVTPLPTDGNGFLEEDDPNCSGSSTSPTTPPTTGASQDKTIKMSDCLFGKSDTMTNTSTTTGSSGSYVSPKSYKDSYVKLVGDATVTYSSSSSTPGATASTSIVAGKYVTIKYVVDEPGKNPEGYYMEILKEVYAGLYKMISERCKKQYTSTTTSTTTTTEPFNRRTSTPDFWEDYGKEQKNRELLSMPGYSALVKSNGERLWAIFDNKLVEPDATKRCDQLSQNPENDFDSMIRRSEEANQKRSEKRQLFYVARKIAFGKLMMGYYLLEQSLLSTEHGVYGTKVREIGLSLLYRKAGTRDIRGEMQRNMEELDSYLNSMAIVAGNDKTTGGLGKSFQATKQSAGTKL